MPLPDLPVRCTDETLPDLLGRFNAAASSPGLEAYPATTAHFTSRTNTLLVARGTGQPHILVLETVERCHTHDRHLLGHDLVWVRLNDPNLPTPTANAWPTNDVAHTAGFASATNLREQIQATLLGTEPPPRLSVVIPPAHIVPIARHIVHHLQSAQPATLVERLNQRLANQRLAFTKITVPLDRPDPSSAPSDVPRWLGRAWAVEQPITAYRGQVQLPATAYACVLDQPGGAFTDHPVMVTGVRPTRHSLEIDLQTQKGAVLTQEITIADWLAARAQPTMNNRMTWLDGLVAVASKLPEMDALNDIVGREGDAPFVECLTTTLTRTAEILNRQTGGDLRKMLIGRTVNARFRGTTLLPYPVRVRGYDERWTGEPAHELRQRLAHAAVEHADITVETEVLFLSPHGGQTSPGVYARRSVAAKGHESLADELPASTIRRGVSGVQTSFARDTAYTVIANLPRWLWQAIRQHRIDAGLPVVNPDPVWWIEHQHASTLWFLLALFQPFRLGSPASWIVALAALPDLSPTDVPEIGALHAAHKAAESAVTPQRPLPGGLPGNIRQSTTERIKRIRDLVRQQPQEVVDTGLRQALAVAEGP